MSTLLDDIAAEFRTAQDGLETMSTREKALALNLWIRSRNLVGMDTPETNYRQLRNCFMGQALRHSPHASLPLISSVIYSSVAGRLGLDAQPCLFPSHVLTLVAPPPGETLDGDAIPPADTDAPADDPPTAAPEGMYLDPYGNPEEVPLGTLQTTLASYGWQTNTNAFLSRASPRNIAMRTAHNIRA
ncbi:hypothetical protein IMZ48_29095, partial [Candidatus Bathyarchaeota archaeon]|nr:hypothetical protein [Candidatus Bathyarchaeota archaeon]